MSNVVCIGSTTMDTAVLVDEFPMVNQITLMHWKKEFCGGSSANVAVGLSRLGVDAALVSKVGKNKKGVSLLHTLVSEGVDIQGVVTHGETAETIILVDKRGEKMIIADTGCVLETADEVCPQYITGDALYVGECFLPVAEKAVDMAQKNDMKIFLRVKNVHISPDFNVDALIDKSHFVIMNETTYSCIDTEYKNVIVTKGKNGCYYPEKDIKIEGIPVDTVDTTGAGDAFCAGLIHHIMEGYPLEDALHFAVAAGAVATTRYGAMGSMPKQREIAVL
ncbi:MAG: carbohydrate kinase family protein [Candidatus Methanofastidiosia archaeon]